MRLLIGIKSCARDMENGFNQLVRDTWGGGVRGADLLFFSGSTPVKPRPDEVVLDCPDDYMSLPRKTLAILGWTTERDYDFAFLCDTDTYVIPERLLSSGFEGYDITGLFNGKVGEPRATEGDAGPWKPSDQPNGATRYWAWISGGNGYWLSRRAMGVILADGFRSGDWAEDRSVGQALGPFLQRGELKALNHEGYGFHYDDNSRKTWVTAHYCSRGMSRPFEQQWMNDRHAFHVAGGNG